MNRKTSFGLVRFILERPFVNAAIVFAVLMAFGTTGHRTYVSENSASYLASIGKSNFFILDFFFQLHLIAALMASLMVPVFIQMGLSLKRRSQLISAVGLLSITIFFIFNFFNFRSDDVGLNAGMLNLLLFFVALGLILVGSLWSAPIGIYVLLAAPLMFGILYASAGLYFGNLGNEIIASPILIANLIIVLLLTLRVNLALNNPQNGLAKYRDEMGIVLGRLLINGLMMSLVLGAVWMLIPHAVNSSEPVLSGDGQRTLGLKLGLIAALSVLFFIPGFIFVKLERKASATVGNFNNKEDFEGSNQVSLLGYDGFWRIMRKAFPLPSSYGFLFVFAISAFALQVRMLPFVNIADYYLTIMATLIGGIGLLSLRAFILIGGTLLLGQILSNWVLNISNLSSALSPLDNLIASGFVIMIIYDVAERFRDISIQKKYSIDVIKEQMRVMTGPYLLGTGLIIFMLLAVYMSGYWPNADMVAKAVLIRACIMFVIVMPMVTILASRYGKF